MGLRRRQLGADEQVVVEVRRGIGRLVTPLVTVVVSLGVAGFALVTAGRPSTTNESDTEQPTGLSVAIQRLFGAVAPFPPVGSIAITLFRLRPADETFGMKLMLNPTLSPGSRPSFCRLMMHEIGTGQSTLDGGQAPTDVPQPMPHAMTLPIPFTVAPA